MAEERYILFFILFHVLFCLVLTILFSLKVLKIPRRNLMFAILLPLWGGVMVFLAAVYTKQNKAGEREQDLPKFEESNYALSRRSLVLDETSDNRVIPLEEALVMEDPAVRRKLILEIVQENPEHYIALLKKVRLGNDSEVSHYASTAIMQVQRAYETALRNKEQQLNQKQYNKEVLMDYINVMKEYIQSGLMGDNVLTAQRRKLNTLYVNIISEYDGNKILYKDAIDNLIELNDYTAAESMLLEADIKWKSDEDFFLLKMKLFYETKNRWAMRKEIHFVKESGMYLSPSTREVMEFWRGQT